MEKVQDVQRFESLASLAESAIRPWEKETPKLWPDSTPNSIHELDPSSRRNQGSDVNFGLASFQALHDTQRKFIVVFPNATYAASFCGNGHSNRINSSQSTIITVRWPLIDA